MPARGPASSAVGGDFASRPGSGLPRPDSPPNIGVNAVPRVRVLHRAGGAFVAALDGVGSVIMMAQNILLPHVKRNVLPEGFLDAPEIGRVSVITEPGHRQRYGPDVDVHLV